MEVQMRTHGRNADLDKVRFAKSYSSFGRCLLAAAMLVLADYPVQSQGPDDGAIRYCLLKNGNVLRGEIEVASDRLAIRMDDNSSVRIRKDEVVYIGASLRELYDYQYSQNLRWGTGEHLQFAKWCIRNGLLLEAEPHYEYLKREMGNKTEFRVLQQLYRQALLDSEEVRQAAGLTPTAAPTIDSLVVTASAIKPNPQSQLDTMSLSADAIGDYRTKILPILESRCGQAACHGEFSPTPLRLYSVNRRSTSSAERSIESVLPYLQPDAPSRSKLLEMAITKHGIQSKRGFDPSNQTDRQFLERLQAWIGGIDKSRDFRAVPSASASMIGTGRMNELHERMKLQSQLAATGMPTSTATDPMPMPLDALQPSSTATISNSEIEQLEAEIARLEQMEQSAAEEPDPFDPELFNRQKAVPGMPR